MNIYKSYEGSKYLKNLSCFLREEQSSYLSSSVLHDTEEYPVLTLEITPSLSVCTLAILSLEQLSMYHIVLSYHLQPGIPLCLAPPSWTLSELC